MMLAALLVALAAMFLAGGSVLQVRAIAADLRSYDEGFDDGLRSVAAAARSARWDEDEDRELMRGERDGDEAAE